MILWLAIVALSAATPPPAATQAPAAIQLTLRVFDGPAEVTGETRVSVYPSGERDNPIKGALEGARGLVALVPPGMYDVQAILEREGQVLAIRWIERLLVIRYPDEGDEHVQVVNFKGGFGALVLRPAGGRGGAFEAAAFPAGDRTTEAARPKAAASYVLFVLPAGSYDFRIRLGGVESWLADFEVPLDRTRLKQVGG